MKWSILKTLAILTDGLSIPEWLIFSRGETLPCMDKVDDCKEKKIGGFWTVNSVFDQIFLSLKANVEHRKGYQSHAETSRKLLLLGARNEFES